ncbi:unnamed protein product [Lathyrus sativus]|nr:unnamed protein product [Lathyrus sativus]
MRPRLGQDWERVAVGAAFAKFSSPKPSFLSKDLHRTSFEPRLWRRLSNDDGIFGQNMDARLGSRCMSQRDAYPSRISVLDENQDAALDLEEIKQKKLDAQIGEGGYGPVFKGVLDNTDVAM